MPGHDCLLVGRLRDPVERARGVMLKVSIVVGANSWTREDGFRVQESHLTFDMQRDPFLGRKRGHGQSKWASRICRGQMRLTFLIENGWRS